MVVSKCVACVRLKAVVCPDRSKVCFVMPVIWDVGFVVNEQ